MSTYITGTEREPFKTFDIAFLGYNSELSKYGLKQFMENNKEQIKTVNWGRSEIYLNDGTRIKAINHGGLELLRGYRFDQLILFDDDRWLIEWNKSEEIRIIRALTMQSTNIPEEFQILKYEDIR